MVAENREECPTTYKNIVDILEQPLIKNGQGVP